jgi:glutathione synthase/RimK-type ligase-like ATP-grasp enzyme
VTARIALVSARRARNLDEDMPPLLAAFAAAGAQAQIVEWHDAGVDWARFDAALLRSAWDYAERVGEFLSWVEQVAARTRLFNPAPVVRWNCDKHYLRELAERGLPVVATHFAEPGGSAARSLEEFLGAHACAELVVKPAIGAGSRDTRRHERDAQAEILAHIQPLLAAGRAVMLQPYLTSVDHAGETALIFIDGQLSHAIRKGPLLPPGAAATSGLFAAEHITARAPQPDEIDVGTRLLAALPYGRLLYARVDLIRDGSGRPCLLELELTEPSLFFAHAQGSAARFAAGALARLTGAGAPGAKT